MHYHFFCPAPKIQSRKPLFRAKITPKFLFPPCSDLPLFGTDWCPCISQLILFMILEHVVYSCNILYQYYIFTYLASKWFNDELKTGRFHSFNTFLDNMISILIFNASKHISLELGNDQFLLLQGNTFQCLLNHTAPIHLQGQRLHMGTKLK